MFEGLKHTFQSFEDHLRNLFEHTEARFSQLKEISETEAEKIADDIRQEFLDLRSDFFSLRKRVEQLESNAVAKVAEKIEIVSPAPPAPVAAPIAVSLPHVIHVPIPEGDTNPEVAVLAAKHKDTLF